MVVLNWTAYWGYVDDAVEELRSAVKENTIILGISRGGLLPAVYLSHHLKLKMLPVLAPPGKYVGDGEDRRRVVTDWYGDERPIEEVWFIDPFSSMRVPRSILLVDDIVDTGDTLRWVMDGLSRHYPTCDVTVFAVVKSHSAKLDIPIHYGTTVGEWVEFPYE